MFKELFLKAQVKDQQNSGSAESGRTMTEMLGVLVIMGILSLGGIAGYRYGMNKHKANETIAELSLYAVDIATQMINNEGADVQLSNLPLKTHMGYPLSAYLGDSEGYFELEVSEVPVGVCEQILKSEWQVPESIIVNDSFVNETEDIIDGTVSVDDACNQAENTMAFEFYKTLTPCEGDACGFGGSTSSEEPPLTDPMDEPCPGENEYRDLNTGECVEDSCPIGTFMIDQNGTCAPCPTEDNPISDTFNSDVSDTCRKCPNAQEGTSYYAPYCIYCPSPRIACGNSCCNEGYFCDNPIYNPQCLPINGCQTDEDCSADKPFCNATIGKCMECRTNADCNNGSETGDYFCNLKGYSKINLVGSCQKATISSRAIRNNVEYVKSSPDINWFGAENFCKALGMEMPSLSDFCPSGKLIGIVYDANKHTFESKCADFDDYSDISDVSDVSDVSDDSDFIDPSAQGSIGWSFLRDKRSSHEGILLSYPINQTPSFFHFSLFDDLDNAAICK